jgi:hypothetical protein
LQPAEAPYLLAYLATIHDPRRGRGRRHPLVAILAMAAAAVLQIAVARSSRRLEPDQNHTLHAVLLASEMPIPTGPGRRSDR